MPPEKKTNRKLNRDEIQEILETNAELYKDDKKLVSYIVELAMYLIEFEYNWNESVAEPPKFISTSSLGRSKSAGSKKQAFKAPQFITKKGGVSSYMGVTSKNETEDKIRCPHCGGEIRADLAKCPHCHNIVH